MSASLQRSRELSGSATLPDDQGPPSEIPAEGSHIGRYVVLDVLGQGGMGVVLRAFDPKLDRKVALKLLHGGSSAQAQARLQREAQALARLSHPNVIRVHDVGTHQGRVFIAMELVTGCTLAEWIGREHAWSEVVRVFVKAGEGLAAAHDAGLVHRDFKPANVLMGDDGQVKVTDFGLARAHQSELESTGHDEAFPGVGEVESASLDATLTRTGALLGTPAYMSPEQFNGKPADPRSDQFSFCVALWEGLAGRRPFEGNTLGKIVMAIEQQKLSGALPARVPRGVARAIRRGLRLSPRARHPGMRVLLRALARGRHVRRRQATWVVATAMVGVGTWWVMRAPAAARASEYCQQVEAQLHGVWDDTRRAQAEQAFLGTGLSYAADTWALARARLDARAEQWVAAQRTACEAEAALGDPADPDEAAAVSRRMVCLHRRQAELRQTGALLVEADAALVERALRVVDSIDSMETCRKETRNPAIIEGPDAHAMAEALAQVQVLQEAAHYDEAVAAAEAARVALPKAPRALQAELRLALARTKEDAGRPEDAEQEYHEAFAAAVASGHHDVALRAALGLANAQVNYSGQPRFDEAERWADHAEASLTHLGGGTDFEGRIQNVRGQIDYHRGEYEAALQHFERALALRVQDLGPDNYRMANYHNNVGQALSALEREPEAIEHALRSLELERAHYGNRHPRVGAALSALCASYSNAGQIDDAIRTGTEAVAMMRETVGEDHPKLGTALTNLGTAQARAGDAKGAEASFSAALRNAEVVYGQEHRRTGLALNNLGVNYEMSGRLVEAERAHRRAGDVFAKALGEAHPTTAIVHSNLASVMLKEGKLDEAEQVLRTTLATLEKRLGPDHPNVAFPLGLLAEVLASRGKPQEALPMLERVMELRQPGRAPPEEIAATQYALGDVLWQAGEDRPRAIELVTAAYESYQTMGQAREDERERARSWLEQRGAAPGS